MNLLQEKEHELQQQGLPWRDVFFSCRPSTGNLKYGTSKMYNGRLRKMVLMTLCDKCTKNEEYHTCKECNPHLCMSCFNTVHFDIMLQELAKD